MAAGGKGSVPNSVAEGIGDALRAVVGCQQAPDAVHYAGQLLEIQMKLLDLAHSMTGGGGQGGQGAPPRGPGGGGPSPLMGGIAGMQGGLPQGPSAATSGAGPSSTGMDPEALRQAALIGGNQ